MVASAGGLVRKNVELIDDALDIVHQAMQDYVISELKSRFGERSWWSEGVNAKNDHNRFNFPDYAVGYTEVSDSTAKSFLDLQTCIKLALAWQLSPKNLGKTAKQPRDYLHQLLDLRNAVCHNGTDYTDSQTIDAMTTIVNVDDIYRLGRSEELNELYVEAMNRSLKTRTEAKKKPIDAPEAPCGKQADAVTEPRPEQMKRRMYGRDARCASRAGEPFPEAPHDAPRSKSLPPGAAAVKACDGMYEALCDRQRKNNKTARFTSRVKAFKSEGSVDDRHYVLSLESAMTFDESAGILIADQEFDGTQANFYNYDSAKKTVQLFPERELREAFERLEASDESGGAKSIAVYTDMKWLTAKTAMFFREFGGRVSFPPPCHGPQNDIVLGESLSEEQMSAVRMALSEPLSYVWGVPGSGKTQHVLAVSIAECLRRGERVAVIAPTNLALEQVLRGLLSAFRRNKGFEDFIDPGHDILRIGTPTAAFAGDYPYVCERKGVETRLFEHYQEYRLACRTLLGRRYESLRGLVEDCVADASQMDEGDQKAAESLLNRMRPVLDVMLEDDDFRNNAANVDALSIKDDVQRIRDMLYSHERTEHLEGEFKGLDDEELKEHAGKLRDEIDGLRRRGRTTDPSGFKVVAMTLSKFILSFGPEGDERRRRLDVDHVFVDEAGYCNCVQTLALFTLGVPVTLLGDHMQLPPVCEIGRVDLKKGIIEEGDHDLDYLWSLSAIYVEHMFDGSSDRLGRIFLDSGGPDYRLTKRAELTATYRFGPNLADVLSRQVYPGMSSMSSSELRIEVVPRFVDSFPVDERSPNGEKIIRRNEAEAKAVSEVAHKLGKKEDYVILTPYNVQKQCIANTDRSLKDNVLTIHKSQGREWDTVIVSVCDGRANPPGSPPRFTSSGIIEGERAGLKVINTALSRAKRRLVLVCDAEWWTEQENELIGDIIRSCRG